MTTTAKVRWPDTEATDALDRAESDNDERKMLWRVLAAYQMCSTGDGLGYNAFCSFLRLPLNRPESFALWELAHECWAEAWSRYGWERLQEMCRIGWNSLYLSDKSRYG